MSQRHSNDYLSPGEFERRFTPTPLWGVKNIGTVGYDHVEPNGGRAPVKVAAVVVVLPKARS
jgi:hypothetical protein